MRLKTNLRSFLLAGSASALLAACSEADVASIGQTGPVTIGGDTGSGATGQTFGNAVGFSCPAGTETRQVQSNGNTINTCAIASNSVLSDLDLSNAGVVSINGAVFVGDDNGAGITASATPTITFAPGQVIIGETGNDYIVITRAAKIDAQGTAAQPIVFTSAADYSDGSADDGEGDANGEWGGLVISGFAPINDCNDAGATGGTVGCVKFGEGNSGLFGGDDPTDDSGVLRYVRVQYAGFRVNDEDELNGIAFQGVGNGGDFSFIQVHNNLDDGVEWFGGTADIRNLVVTGAGDDSLDWTDGWTGTAQFVVVDQSELRGDRGIEADNRNGDNDITPRSNPSISNFTFLGGASGDTGMVLRRGTAGKYINGIISGFQDAAIDLDDQATVDQIGTGELKFFSLLLGGNNEDFEGGNEVDTNNDDINDAPDGFEDDAETLFNADSNNRIVTATTLNEGLFPGEEEDATTAVTPSTVDSSLSDVDAAGATVDYVGAFAPGTTSGSAANWAAGWTLGLSFDQAAGCPAGTVETNTAVPAGRSEARICVFSSSGSVTSDITLTRGNLYQLEGALFIGEDNANSATLTIDPGVTIFGSTGNDYLVIARGSSIKVNGTPNQPVVMTSRADVQGDNDGSERGQWGGLVISGNAPINDCNDAGATGGTVGCVKFGEGNSGLFGGDDATDGDGSNLNYLRVQYAGFRVNDEDELNGIAFQGTGSGLEVDYVQIHNNLDDGLEWFGGTTNAKHVVITGAGDDSLDWTDGWTGAVQYAIVVQQSAGGDRGIEADNRNGDNDITPRSNPTFSNFTFVGGFNDVGFGSGFGDTGMVLRRGTAGLYANGLITNFRDAAIDFDDQSTVDQAIIADELNFRSVFISDNNESFEGSSTEIDTNNDDIGDSPDGFEDDIETTFDEDPNNVDGESAVLSSTLSVGADDTGITAALVPGVNENAVTPVDPTTLDPSFGAGSYAGAVENDADNWYVGWTIGL